MHNDKTIDINLDYQRLQGKSYNIDFIQTKTDKIADEEIKAVLQSEKQTTKQLQEKAVKESIIEEKATCKEENNTAATTIEQELDYWAKKLSDSQSYVGCFVFNVKDRLQEMIDTKGKDYAMNYMKTHWPKIDLTKVM